MASAPHRPQSPVAAHLRRLHERHAPTTDGEVASYIPELGEADPSWFGIAIATVDGAVYEVGDTAQPFTIQSISKPLTYGMALEERGEAFVRSRIGIEPTGEAFNAILLDEHHGTPRNPMVNAGAIAAVGLLEDHADDPVPARLKRAYARYAGHPLDVDPSVLSSESVTGHRNRAIAHLLRASEVITGDPDTIAERYFGQCSTLVDCHDLALIAATLAAGGVNPVTGERAAREETVRRVLSVMTSCGMYDGAGAWLYTVGLPAKSGVSGGIMAVLPGQLGIGVFSPPLDAAGNSVRGVRVCEELSRDLQLHLIRVGGGRPPAPVRSAFRLSELGSKRLRTPDQRALLAADGGTAAAFELQGDLTFLAVEQVSRAVEDADAGLVVLDLRRVGRIDGAVPSMLADLETELAASGGRLVLSSVGDHADALGEAMREAEGPFAELDLALEWCEERILAAGGLAATPARIDLADHEILRGLSADQVERFTSVLDHRRFTAGEVVLRRGEVADEVLFVTAGELSVFVELPGGERRRLATLQPGMLLGEMAFITGDVRAGDVLADTDVEAWALRTAALEELADVHPEARLLFLQNLLRILSHRAQQLRGELATLAG